MKNKYPFFLFAFIILHSTLLLAQRTFDTKVDYATGTRPTSIAIGDLNGDGKLDLAVSNQSSNTINVFTNTGVGIFGAKVDYATGSVNYSVVIGDLNGDGMADMAVANTSYNTLSVFTNTGTGNFGVKVDYSTGNSPWGLAIGDLNSDGKPDLVSANYGFSTISVLTNTGVASFGSKVDYTIGPSPLRVATGDLNGDGKADLAVVNGTNLSVLTNTGSGNFGIKKDYTTGMTPWNLSIGDLNGDGKADLAVANSSSGNISVLTNTGSGNLGAKVDYATGSSPRSVAIGDLNGDGKVDLAVANLTNNTVSVLINDGTGSFLAKKDYDLGAGTGPFSVEIGDFNGDNKADLVVANYNSNTISVLLAKETQFINGFTVSNKLYGNIFAFNATATSGLSVSYVSSNASVLKIVGNLATATGIGVVTVTAFRNGNATFAGVTLTGVLTITKANLSVSANNFSKVYGSVNPILTGTLSGVVNNDVIVPSFTTTATSLSGVGIYPITISATGSNINNYALTINNSVLTITKANLTVTAFNANRKYGEANPTLTGTIVGTVNNDVIESVFSTTANTTSNIGNYPIQATATGSNINNYALTINNSTLTITKANLTVTAFNASKKYGEANPTLSGTVAGIQNNDVIVPTFSTIASTISNVGNYPIQATATGSNINNYALILSNSILSIEKASQTLQIDPIANFTFSGANVVVSIAGSASSGLPLAYEVIISPETAAKFDANTNEINFTATGIATITGMESGNANYLPAVPTTIVFKATRLEENPIITVPSSISKGIESEIVKIFPNPSSGICFVEAATKTNIAIYNSVGTLVEYFNTLQKQSFTLQAKGLYILKAQQGNKWQTLKLEIE